tara:strand:- start:1319 stop:1849 length:531 start_codon:yes stop_codon:yes gene_type:complete
MSPVTEILQSAGALQFFEYWNSLPKTGFVPDRSDFNPPAIHRLMPSVTLLEVVSSDRVEMRLIGTDLVERMGGDPTGKNYLDYVALDARSTYLETLSLQINRPCGRRSILQTREASGVLSRVEVLTLPMTHKLSGHPLILSYFGPTEAIGFDGGSDREVRIFENIQWIDIGAGVPA